MENERINKKHRKNRPNQHKSYGEKRSRDFKIINKDMNFYRL
ncbi:MAG: hypothetical protein ACRC4M_00785 [Mycoplasma sp.]